MFDIFFISEFILGTGFLKKAFGEFYFPQNFRRSTLKFCNWFQMDLITWFYSPKSQWREAFWDDFFWEVDIPLRPSLFVGRGTYKDGSGIIMLNWSMLKSTYVWEHCAVQIAVSWYCMVVRAKVLVSTQFKKENGYILTNFSWSLIDCLKFISCNMIMQSLH